MKILAQRGLTWSGLIRLLSTNLRESGIRVTGRKIMAQLLRSEVSFDIERYTRWFERHGIEGASPAGDVFGAPAVAIIGALDIPQCKKYRVLQKVEYFSLRGIACEYCDYRDLSQAFSLMQLATVVIFYRLPQGPSSAALIDEALRLGQSLRGGARCPAGAGSRISADHGAGGPGNCQYGGNAQARRGLARPEVVARLAESY